MVSEENEIALVVQRYDPPCVQVWSLGEERCKHSANAMAKHRVKVIKDQLRIRVTWGSSMADDLVPKLDAGNPEIGSWAIW